MNTIRRVGKNIGVIILGDLINKIIGLVITIYLARYLGDLGFGRYSLVFAYISFFGIVADLGINAILIREISRNKNLAAKYIGNAITIKILSSLAAFLLSILIVGLIGYPETTRKLIFFFSITLLFHFSDPLNALFQIELKMEYSIAINVFTRVISAIFIFWIVIFRKGLEELFILLVISAFSGTILTLIFSRKFVKPKLETDFDIWKFFIVESWPLALTSVFITIYLRIDQIMLSLMVSDAAVGYYSATVNLVESLNIIPIAFMTSISPLLSASFSRSMEEHIRIYKLSFRYMNILVVPIAVGTTILANSIIWFFYGDGFLPSIPALQILIWSEIFVFMGIVNNWVMISANKQRFDFIFTSISAIINIILNMILIPIFSYIGAGIATVISYAIGPILGLFLSATRDYSIEMFSTTLKPLSASIIMGTIIYFTTAPSLPLSISVGGVIYFGSLYLIKGISSEDLKFIRILITGN